MDRYVFSNFDVRDDERILTTQKIKVENIMYNAFRHKMRLVVNEPHNIEIKNNLRSLCDESYLLYNTRVSNIQKQLSKLLDKHFVFSSSFDDSFILTTDNLNLLDLYKLDQKLSLPNKNLITGQNNKQLYLQRLVDEIVRYDSVKLFFFDPDGYLLMVQDNYKVNDDEVFVPSSIVDKEYFSDLTPHIVNDFGNYTNYDEVNLVEIITMKILLTIMIVRSPKVKRN